MSAASSESSGSKRLRELADLHDAGIVSDDEFASKKAQLLDEP